VSGARDHGSYANVVALSASAIRVTRSSRVGDRGVVVGPRGLGAGEVLRQHRPCLVVR